MIRVTVELRSAITGRTTVLGTAEIVNDGTGTHTRGNYRARFYGKGGRFLRESTVGNFPRKRLLAWDLLLSALSAAFGDRS